MGDTGNSVSCDFHIYPGQVGGTIIRVGIHWRAGNCSNPVIARGCAQTLGGPSFPPLRRFLLSARINDPDASLN